jgi:hypothetical protein
LIPYISDDDLLRDLGHDIARAHYDRNRDGVCDASELWKVRCDATSKIRTRLGGVFKNLPGDTALAVASIDAVNHRIVMAEPHGFVFRSRIIFTGEDVPEGLDGILRIDGLYYARKVEALSFEISVEPGGPRVDLSTYVAPLPPLAVVQHIPDQVVALTRQAAVIEALKTLPKLNRMAEWKAYDDALEREFKQLVRGPDVLDANRAPADPGANRETFSVDAPAVLWNENHRCRFPTGMY